LFALAGGSDLVVVGDVVKVSEKSFTLLVREVVAGHVEAAEPSAVALPRVSDRDLAGDATTTADADADETAAASSPASIDLSAAERPGQQPAPLQKQLGG
jgi:hypothetical protein